MNQNLTILLGRIGLAVIFIGGGLGKFSDLAGTAGFFGHLGLPMPAVTAFVVAAFELLAGVGVLLGFLTRPTAYALAAFCIASALLAHLNFADQMQSIMFMKNLAITGGFLVLAAFGPGRFSLDARRDRG